MAERTVVPAHHERLADKREGSVGVGQVHFSMAPHDHESGICGTAARCSHGAAGRPGDRTFHSQRSDKGTEEESSSRTVK